MGHHKMMQSLQKLIIAALIVAARIAAASTPAFAQETLDEVKVKPSIVHLVVKATPNLQTAPGVSPQLTEISRGTGFVVSADGFILTSFHLLPDPTAIREPRPKIMARFGSTSAQEKELSIVKSDKAFDLLMLKAPTEIGETYPHLQFADAGEIGAIEKTATLVSLGFPLPENAGTQTQPITSEGKLKDWNGPGPHLWNTSLSIDAGYSGSPIFLHNGKVVGIATADSKLNKTTNFMVPAYLADSLLSHIRFAQMQKQINALITVVGDTNPSNVELAKATLVGRVAEIETNMDDLQTRIEWDAEMSGGQLYVSYAKLVTGGPPIESVLVQVTPLLFKTDDSPFADTRFPDSLIPVAEAIGSGAEGKFRVPKINSKIQSLVHSKGKDIGKFSELKISVVATLKGQNRQRAQSFVKELDPETLSDVDYVKTNDEIRKRPEPSDPNNS
jgi:S1-C subfamily serine protease